LVADAANLRKGSSVHAIDLKYSDYVVYVDESGDHSLESVNPRFPVFVLAFCLFQKSHYANIVTPAVRMLKFDTFGHDMVVFHEYEIRKKRGYFQFLSKEPREKFMEELSGIIAKSDFTLIPVVIDKHALKESKQIPSDIYHLAMKLGLEQLHHVLKSFGQNGITHVVFEARGRKEDAELELEFRRICDRDNSFGVPLPFKIVVADKKTNSEGLQFADMVARPVGLSVIRPEESNRAVRILERKFYQIQGKGAFTQEPYLYPYKAKGPKVVPEAQAPVR
jgi:hypothetical protein